MNGRIKMVIAGCVIAASSSVITSTVMSQPEAGDMEEMMKVWMELAQPGEVHKGLAQSVGHWKQSYTSWDFPGAEPVKSKGSSEMKMILGGRFLQEDVNATFNMMGQETPMQGRGIFGFDRMRNKHVFTWMDTFGTMMMHGEGDASDDGKVVTYMTEMPSPQGDMMDMKMVWRHVSDNKHVVEMHIDMDGEWFKNMEIVSTR